MSKTSNKPFSNAVPLVCIAQGNVTAANLSKGQKTWLEQNSFSGKTGQLLAFPDGNGVFTGFAFGLGQKQNRSPLILGTAAAKLPSGLYRFVDAPDDQTLAALAFKLGSYRFARYNGNTSDVVLDNGDWNIDEVDRLAESAFIARDFINTPANDLGPDLFETEIRSFAKTHKMNMRSIVGDDLLKSNLPLVHAVGRAGAEAPRMLELNWGNKGAAKVTLVGKGVTFDTGGLDIKPASGMVLMKKDMGGAANILGLVHAIVSAKLNICLRVLLPVVENSIAGNAFRPSDILPSRAGLNVEIGNTDAEGRLILADALTLASEGQPDLLIDMATLTGAARVALGPDLPPIYSTDSDLARQLVDLGTTWGDPLWHMPLWSPYDSTLSSSVADLNNIPAGGIAGSITAALFLQRFVKDVGAWVHMDIFGWAPEKRPGRPQGGTDQGIRAAFMMLKKHYT